MAQLGRAAHGAAFDGHHDVALPQAGASGGRSGLDPRDQGAALRANALCCNLFCGQILESHADLTTPHRAEAQQLVHHAARQVRGYGKADPDIAAALR